MVDPAPPVAPVNKPEQRAQKRSAREKIESFFDNPESTARFLAFVEEILREKLSLQDIMARKHLHRGVQDYGFERMELGNEVILLRILGRFFAVRLVSRPQAALTRAVATREAIDPDTLVQFLNVEDFIKLWRATARPPKHAKYNTVSSIRPYTEALISGKDQHWHGRDLLVESVLGVGLEGTVFLVRDKHTQQRFALKKTYKDLGRYFEYWSHGLAELAQRDPDVIPYLCKFDHYESHDSKGAESRKERIPESEQQGSSVLMEYKPLTSLAGVVGDLSDRDRLEKGLKILADTVRVVRALWDCELRHGDVGVSNVFVYPTADDGEHTILIDPHADVADFDAKPERFKRKDLFGLVHMLYWLVTKEQWPRGTLEYVEQFISGKQHPMIGKFVFTHPPQATDFDYRMLHGAAVKALWSEEEKAFELALELILARANR